MKLRGKISSLLRQMISPAFIILLVASFALWFTGRLSRTYTTPVEVEVEIITDYDSEVWIEQGSIIVDLLASGDGRDLAWYKMGFGAKISIPLSQLEIEKQSPQGFTYRISENSMERAIGAATSKFRVVGILDTIERITVSPFVEKKLPIVANIEVECMQQYMVEDGVHLSIDSIMVKAPMSVLSEVDAIYTEELNFREVRESLQGSVSLSVPRGMVLENREVQYRAKVVGFTEIKREIGVKFIGDASALIVPRRVELTTRVPINISEEITLVGVEVVVNPEMVDHRGVAHSLRVVNLPKEVMSYTVQPEFVEVYIQR